MISLLNQSAIPDDEALSLVAAAGQMFGATVRDACDVILYDDPKPGQVFHGVAIRSGNNRDRVPGAARPHLVKLWVRPTDDGYPTDNTFPVIELFPDHDTAKWEAEALVERRGIAVGVGTYRHDNGEVYDCITYLKPYGGWTAPVTTIQSWREALVYVAAHEFGHIMQYVAGGRISEVQCERMASKALINWRQTADIRQLSFV